MKLFLIRCLVLSSLIFSSITFANDPNTTQTPTETEINKELIEKEEKRIVEQKKQQSVIESLENTQEALEEKLKEQLTLQGTLQTADQAVKAETQASLDKVNLEIKNLRQSFEQVAIGGVSLDEFAEEEVFDWKKELVIIVQPVLEGLKSLTDKPRKIERFRTIIAERGTQSREIEKAIKTVENRIASQLPKTITKELEKTLETWQGYKKDNLREIELAKVQLESLLGNDVTWYQTLSMTFTDFFAGRGKTLFIALLVSIAVWLVMKYLLLLLMYQRKKQSTSSDKPSNKPRKLTSYRVALYLYKLLTTLLIVLAIMVVLYVRGDLLLLALMAIVFVGLVLTLKKILPSYIIELKMLLNMGTAREGERIIYNGIPWELTHINVHTILKNPSLQGVLRIPLSELSNIHSRTINNDDQWFPTKKGDFLLMPDDSLAEVLAQTPDNIKLKSRGGMTISHPSANFFSMNLYNLTKGGSFGVTSIFGIDYSLIEISLTTVPEVFKEATLEGLRKAGLKEHVDDILVDFQSANSSSLDYLIYVTMNSRAASSYFKIGRIIQQSCVRACNENNWEIPFPQLTLHKANPN